MTAVLLYFGSTAQTTQQSSTVNMDNCPSLIGRNPGMRANFESPRRHPPPHTPQPPAPALLRSPATASRLPPTVRRLRRPTPHPAARASLRGRRTLICSICDEKSGSVRILDLCKLCRDIFRIFENKTKSTAILSGSSPAWVILFTIQPNALPQETLIYTLTLSRERTS